MEQFSSLTELTKAVPDEIAARKFMETIIWGDTPLCPHCYGKGGYKLKDGKSYKCTDKRCAKRFTVTVGTVFEGTHIKLTKWIYAIYLCTIHKRGISSYQLAIDIKVTQKTAWFMLHRIRKLFLNKAHEVLVEEVELDETFVGGKNRNRHRDKKYGKTNNRDFGDKIPVLGMIQRGGPLVACVIPNVRQNTLEQYVCKHIHHTATLYTDDFAAYFSIHQRHEHYIVEHSKGLYSVGNVTTNRIENFWSHLKRAVIGVFYKVSRKHLQRYVDEIVFKFNQRGTGVFEKIRMCIENCRSKLKYKDLLYSQDIYYG